MVKNIYISNNDRLTRLSSKTIKELFLKYDVNIITIQDKHSEDNDN